MANNDSSNRKRLTKRLVEALEPGSILWDSEVKGFGVRCQRRNPVYILRATIKHRTRWFSIGTHGSPWTVETARAPGALHVGRHRRRNGPRGRAGGRAATTVVEAARAMVSRRTCGSTQKATELRSRQAQHFTTTSNPCWATSRLLTSRVPISDRFKRDVRDGKTAREEKRGHRAKSIVRGGPGAANRCLALLSKMFNWAEQRGYRSNGSNPCRHIEKYREGRHERFLSDQELATLAGVMAESGSGLAQGGGSAREVGRNPRG